MNTKPRRPKGRPPQARTGGISVNDENDFSDGSDGGDVGDNTQTWQKKNLRPKLPNNNTTDNTSDQNNTQKNNDTLNNNKIKTSNRQDPAGTNDDGQNSTINPADDDGRGPGKKLLKPTKPRFGGFSTTSTEDLEFQVSPNPSSDNPKGGNKLKVDEQASTGRETVFDIEDEASGSTSGPNPSQQRINDIRRRRYQKYKPEEIVQEVEEVDTQMNENVSLRRNGILVTDPESAAQIRAAAEEIARSKWKDYLKAGAKVTVNILGVVGTIAAVVLAPPAAVAGVPVIVYLVWDGIKATFKTITAITDIVAAVGEVNKLTPAQAAGVKRLQELTGAQFQGPQKSAEALEEYKAFRIAAAEGLKDKKQQQQQKKK